MSLDVYLHVKRKVKIISEPKIYIREGGSTKEISLEEWNQRFPNKEPFMITLDGDESDLSKVFEGNITHNLGKMASEAGLYYPLWQPETLGIVQAKQLIELLEQGLFILQNNPEHYKQFNPSNGWGNYEGLVQFVEEYLIACLTYPDAEIKVSR